MQRPLPGLPGERYRVSILTGSGEPVQLTTAPALVALGVFQSSPAPESRCNLQCYPGMDFGKVFQSSPAPESRCNIRG